MSVLRLYSLLVQLQLLTCVHCGVLLTAAGRPNVQSIEPIAAGDVLIEACPTYVRSFSTREAVVHTAYTRQQM